MNTRLLELDAIRGIAVLMVILFHYTVRYYQLFQAPIPSLYQFEFGKYGVQLFFIVSGFVIFLTLQKTDHPSDFIVSRISRLYPAYWIAIFLTFSSIKIFSLPGREVDFQTAIINLSMVQKWFSVTNVDGVYWTLAVELSSYIIMLFLFAFNALDKMKVISAIWMLIIIISKYVDIYFSIQIHWLIKLMLVLDFGHLFIAGVMFYHLYTDPCKACYIYLLCSLMIEYLSNADGFLIVSIFYILFFLFVKGFLRFISIKPLVYFGTISYSLYLIHQNIGYIIIRNLEIYGFSTPLTVVIVPLFMSIIIASLMQKYIEKPLLIKIRNKWHGSGIRRYVTAHI